MTNYLVYEMPSNYKFIYNQNFQFITTSAILLTSDNYYVLGKMDNSLSALGKVTFLESTLNIDSLINNELYPIIALKSEVLTKLGVDLNLPSEIKTINPYCFITENNLSFINLCFEIKLNLSTFEIVTLFNSHTESLHNQNLKQDVSSIVFVENKPKPMNDFVLNNKNILIDYAKILLEILNNTRIPKSFLLN